MLVAPQAVNGLIRVAVRRIIVEALQQHILVNRPFLEHVRARADDVIRRDIASISINRLDGFHRVDNGRLRCAREHVQQHDGGMVKRQGDGVIIYHREARVANHLARRAEALQPAVQGRHHIGGGHFLAIVELHALAEVESERGVVVAHVVAFAQFRRNAAVRLQGNELLHHRAAQHVAAIDGGILVQVVGRALVVIGNVDDVQIVLCESCGQSQRRQQGQRHEQGEEFLCHFAFLPSFVLPGVKIPCPIHSRFLPLSGAARF